MEMQVSPNVYFDSKSQDSVSVSPSFEPMPKKLKSDFTFQCIICNDVYSDLDVMYEHMKSQHPEMYAQSNQQLAPECGNDNADSNFHHDNNLSDEEYSDLCRLLEPICELRLIDDGELQILPHDKNNSENKEDSEQFHLQQLQLQHRLNDLRKTTINGRPIVLPRGPGRGRRREIPMEMNNERQPPPPESCLFQCTQCDSSFIFAGDLAKHVRSHTQNKPYQCAICFNKFSHIASLNTHIRIHSGEKPYKCKHKSCSLAFTQLSSLLVHQRSHSTRKPHQCEICDKGFVNSSSLILHLKSHADGDPYPCNDCDKRFKTATSLAEHHLTHTDTYLYQCSICRQSYQQSCELVQHMKSHFGEKPFACLICNRSFTQPGSLNTHIRRIHIGEKPFSCSKCNKQYVEASSLSVHMRVHSKKKQFCCSICQKYYSQQSYLNKHMLIHAEENIMDYSCKWCNKAFNDSPKLINHIVQEHDSNENGIGTNGSVTKVCIICQKDFHNRADLLFHLREHVEDGPLKYGDKY